MLTVRSHPTYIPAQRMMRGKSFDNFFVLEKAREDTRDALCKQAVRGEYFRRTDGGPYQARSFTLD